MTEEQAREFAAWLHGKRNTRGREVRVRDGLGKGSTEDEGARTMKRYLVQVFCLADYGEEPASAVITLTPERVASLRKLKEALQAACEVSGEDINGLSLWDYSPEYIFDPDDTLPVGPDGFFELVQEDQIKQVQELVAAVEKKDFIDALHTEHEKLHICKDGFFWSALIKHTDIRLETQKLDWKVLEGA